MATSIGEFELKVMKRVALHGGRASLVSPGAARIGEEILDGEDGARVVSALLKLESAEYLERQGDAFALTEQGTEYLDLLGLA
ncbi:MAG: hypothetical protein AMXMBFR64_27690 [Myxococcales bacterium]